jgi:hypothetical protein
VQLLANFILVMIKRFMVTRKKKVKIVKDVIELTPGSTYLLVIKEERGSGIDTRPRVRGERRQSPTGMHTG